jgi:hypothetical protein
MKGTDREARFVPFFILECMVSSPDVTIEAGMLFIDLRTGLMY